MTSPEECEGTPTRDSPRGVHGKATGVVAVVRVRREIKWRVPHDRVFSEWKVGPAPSDVYCLTVNSAIPSLQHVVFSQL